MALRRLLKATQTYLERGMLPAMTDSPARAIPRCSQRSQQLYYSAEHHQQALTSSLCAAQ